MSDQEKIQSVEGVKIKQLVLPYEFTCPIIVAYSAGFIYVCMQMIWFKDHILPCFPISELLCAYSPKAIEITESQKPLKTTQVFKLNQEPKPLHTAINLQSSQPHRMKCMQPQHKEPVRLKTNLVERLLLKHFLIPYHIYKYKLLQRLQLRGETRVRNITFSIENLFKLTRPRCF